MDRWKSYGLLIVVALAFVAVGMLFVPRLGIEADEAIHCIIDVMNARAPYTVIRRAVHIHPTVAELIPTLLSEIAPLQ